jgi:4-aminobutyrate aminotransferase-like enzyme
LKEGEMEQTQMTKSTKNDPVEMQSPTLSLIDLVGESYINAVYSGRSFLEGQESAMLWMLAEEKVDFIPVEFRQRLDELIDYVGEQVCEPLNASESGRGAATNSFNKASHPKMAPLSGYGFIRIGEDGRAYLVSKSEHYHASLGHSFPGYQLIENARQLGIPNATHNNTRGHITRVLEQELIRTANGIERGDPVKLKAVIDSNQPHVLNRVISLETGSLAVEAGFKMMLARFYRLDDTYAKPKYDGRVPVFLVMADNAGGKKANYHGTTLFTQFMRGMWPELANKLEENKIFVTKAVSINDIAHFERLVEEYDQGPYKIAGFFHEIILMNYGGIRLDEEFLKQAYATCHAHDIPVLVDEIQSCIWSPELFLFREYGLDPDFVSVGKGFPGGEYPASRILTTAEMDSLNQFGALVTNGQEELASLAYLITMEFAQANRDYIREIGEYYEGELNGLLKRYPKIIAEIEGQRHLSSIFFYNADQTIEFIQYLNKNCIDISAQTYKANCPPAALTKIPLISSRKMVDFLVGKMDDALQVVSSQSSVVS